MCSAQNRRRKMWSDYRNREKNEKRSSAWWGKRRNGRRGLDFVGKMSVFSYGSGSWWCLSCYVDTVWTSFLLAEISHCKREIIGKSETSAGLRSLLSCWRRPHLCPKLTGFQNSFLFNVECAFPVETAETGNFWAHSCYRANRFCKLCRTWLKRCWLLRKRQCMRDRKRIGGLQRSLFFLLLLLTWETHAGNSNIRKTVSLWETFFFFFSSLLGQLWVLSSNRTPQGQSGFGKLNVENNNKA